MIPDAPKYELVENESIKEFICVKILEGPFSELVYYYSYVKIGDDVEDAPFQLDFHYNIITGIVDDPKKFEETAAAILTDIIIGPHHEA